MAYVLVLNAGSSSLKWSLLDAASERTQAAGDEPWTGGREAARAALERLRRLPAVSAASAAPAAWAIGHRLVHGGRRFRDAVRLDEPTRKALADLAEIDPL